MQNKMQFNKQKKVKRKIYFLKKKKAARVMN